MRYGFQETRAFSLRQHATAIFPCRAARAALGLAYMRRHVPAPCQKKQISSSPCTVPTRRRFFTSALQTHPSLAAVSVGSPWKKLYMSLLRFPSRHCCKKALYQGSRHLMTSDKGQKERIDPGPVSQNMDKAFRARPGGTSKGLLQRYVPDTGCSCQKSPHITVFTPPNERFFRLLSFCMFRVFAWLLLRRSPSFRTIRLISC